MAKLPEENKDGWAALEHEMNKESIKKEPVAPTVLKKAESLQVSMGFQTQSTGQIKFNDMSPFGKSFSPSPMVQGFNTQYNEQPEIVMPPKPQEEDYVS